MKSKIEPDRELSDLKSDEYIKNAQKLLKSNSMNSYNGDE